MSIEIRSELNDLRHRLERLERTRTNRGRTNRRGAAAYLGRSREFLRQLHLRGEGPRRAADGSYTYDDLDAYAEEAARPRLHGAERIARESQP